MDFQRTSRTYPSGIGADGKCTFPAYAAFLKLMTSPAMEFRLQPLRTSQAASASSFCPPQGEDDHSVRSKSKGKGASEGSHGGGYHKPPEKTAS
eukprot:2681128-Amphidinium_carterae.1